MLIVGGTHLATATDAELDHIVSVIAGLSGLQRIMPSHCSGERPYVALAKALGDRVQPCPAGTVLQFA